MINNRRNFYRIVIHIQVKGAVAFAPYTMLPAHKAVVTGEDNKGIFKLPLFFQSFYKPAYIIINTGNGGIVAYKRFSGVLGRIYIGGLG